MSKFTCPLLSHVFLGYVENYFFYKSLKIRKFTCKFRHVFITCLNDLKIELFFACYFIFTLSYFEKKYGL